MSRTLAQIKAAAIAAGPYAKQSEFSVTKALAEETNNLVLNLDNLYSTDAERVAAINDLQSALNTAIESGDTTVSGLLSAAQTLLQGKIDEAKALAEAAQAAADAETIRATAVEDEISATLDSIAP